MRTGVDASYARPGAAGLAAARPAADAEQFTFFIGYVSPESGKNVTATEIAEYHAHGVAVGLVWENDAQDALKGLAAGLDAGRKARNQANALGFPATLPVYFAVDFDVTPGQLAGPVHSYAEGFAQGAGVCGVYGGYAAVAYAAAHLQDVGYRWQTYAWSDGRWHPANHIEQYSNGHAVAGGTVDYNRAMQADFGQWEAQMPELVPADVTLATWGLTANKGDSEWDVIPNTSKNSADSPAATPPGTNANTSAGFALGRTRALAEDSAVAIASLRGQVAALAAQVAKLPTTAAPAAPLSATDVAAIADAVAARLYNGPAGK